MLHTLWQNRVKEVVKNELDTTSLAAFNTNVDVVVHLNNANLAPLEKDERIDVQEVQRLIGEDILEINTENEFLAVLLAALQEGKSHYIVLRNMQLLDWLEKQFSTRNESMGGQAGIIANQMAALGARSIVYTSLLSSKQGSMFLPSVQVPVIDDNLSLVNVMDGVREDHTKENWIFEYAKGEKFSLCGQEIVTPRANRVIFATRPEGVVMGFSPEMEEHLAELGEDVDVAFLAGFHYAPTEEAELNSYLDASMASVKRLKQDNSRLRIHFEYVPMSDTEAEKTMLQTVSSEIQSFGINENEIKRVLTLYNYDAECAAIEEDERAYCLFQGCLKIMDTLQFERMHLHNLGYYVVLLRKPYEVAPTHVRAACLYASSVNAIKAKYGGYVPADKLPEAGDITLSPIGLEQMEKFAAEMRKNGYAVPANFSEEGILELDDYYVLVVPAHVVSDPVSTVGMGDTISSSAFAYEWSHTEPK